MTFSTPFHTKHLTIFKKSHQKSFIQYLKKILPNNFFRGSCNQTLVATVKPEDLDFILKVLRLHTPAQFNLLTAISGVDYPYRKRRFEVIYELLSIRFNSRIRIKTFVNETKSLTSIASIFVNATWWEREIWDLFGVFFGQNDEIKRILTDYGFEGHPLRKDFPLCGYVESRYDDMLKRVVCEPIEHAQEFRNFEFISGWSSQSIK
jgi:NADH dehydrogenase (ubiquinone) Fe-S protein 3